MPRLILVRHGQTAWNTAKRYQGQTDIPLDATGALQAENLGRRLAAEQLDLVLTSDLMRARQTAEAILAHHSLALQPERRLCEISMGSWEGKTFGDIQAAEPDCVDAWLADPLHSAPHGGESLADLALRLSSLLGELREHPRDETILLVSHGGTLSVLLCLALGMPPEYRWRLRLDPASLSELWLYDEGGILTSMNDQHHLAEKSR